jgi:type III restriction enzyme
VDNGQPHDYVPDFIVRMKCGVHVILKTKGYDPKEDVKAAAAQRWVDAVNADGTFGTWEYATAHSPNEVPGILSELATRPGTTEAIKAAAR